MSAPSHYVVTAELHHELQSLLGYVARREEHEMDTVGADIVFCVESLADAIPVEHHERLLLARGYVEAYVVPEDDEDVYGLGHDEKSPPVVPAVDNKPVVDLMQALQDAVSRAKAERRQS